MGIMDDRENAFENKFANDEKIKFKIEMMRNKLMGGWLADKFGLAGEAKEKYIEELMVSDLKEPGIEDVIEKIKSDLKKYNVSIDEDEIKSKMEECWTQALSDFQATIS